MSYRKILVPLSGGERDHHVLQAGFEIAKAFDGHVAGLFVRPDPGEVLPYLGEGISAGVIQEIMDASREAANRAAASARGNLDQHAKSNGATTLGGLKSAGGCSCSFHIREGNQEIVLIEESLLSDLIVFDAPHEAKGSSFRATLESTLLNARRPLLLVPSNFKKLVGAKIAIGWDGGSAASHAVSRSIALLQRAEAVEILNVHAGPIETHKMDRLRDYLRLHGVQPVEHGINPGGQSIGLALLDAAQRSGAGVLVIGGYGHSRVREMILGGVTRQVFAQASLPIFIAH